MFKNLKRLIFGDRLFAKIIECRDEIKNKKVPHTLVEVQGERRWVKGHLGKPGEQIIVNSKELNSY